MYMKQDIIILFSQFLCTKYKLLIMLKTLMFFIIGELDFQIIMIGYKKE